MGDGSVGIARGGKFMGVGYCGNAGMGQRECWFSASPVVRPCATVATAVCGARQRWSPNWGRWGANAIIRRSNSMTRPPTPIP